MVEVDRGLEVDVVAHSHPVHDTVAGLDEEGGPVEALERAAGMPLLNVLDREVGLERRPEGGERFPNQTRTGAAPGTARA